MSMRTTATTTCGSRRPGTPLDDAAARALVASTPGFLVIAYSTAWSLTCRLLRPVVDKLAVELDGQATVARVDGDLAPGFRRDHAIAGIPQLLVFENGLLTNRLTEFDDPRLVRLRLRRAVRPAAPGACGEAEQMFHEAHAQALRLFHELTEPANRALRPHLDRIAPMLEALELRLAGDRLAGLITDDMEMEQRSAAFEAAFGPIRPELDALDTAEKLALRAYEDLMDEAVDEYRAQAKGGRDQQGWRAAAV